MSCQSHLKKRPIYMASNFFFLILSIFHGLCLFAKSKCLSESKRIVHKKNLAHVQKSKYPTVLKGKSLNKKNISFFLVGCFGWGFFWQDN